MSTLVPDLPLEPRETFVDDLVGMGSFFIDPAGAAKRASNKWFWVGPLIVVSIVAIVAQLLRIPIMQQAMESMGPQNGISPEQFDKQIQIGMMVQHIITWAMPLIMLVVYCFEAAIMLAMASVLTVNAKFLNLFNIVAGCSLIGMLEAISSVVVLKMKAPVSTMAELKPPLGLDIFFSEGTNKFLMAILGYFTIFNIWWIVMNVLVLSIAFRISKGKAFAMVAPVVVLTLTMLLLGAAFTPSQS